MLDDVLRLAANKGTLTTSELARDLAISPAVVEQLFAELARHGYLQMAVPGCGVPCEHCPVKEACLFLRQPRLWTLTAKGERALRRLPRRDDGNGPVSQGWRS